MSVYKHIFYSLIDCVDVHLFAIFDLRIVSKAHMV